MTKGPFGKTALNLGLGAGLLALLVALGMIFGNYLRENNISQIATPVKHPAKHFLVVDGLPATEDATILFETGKTSIPLTLTQQTVDLPASIDPDSLKAYKLTITLKNKAGAQKDIIFTLGKHPTIHDTQLLTVLMDGFKGAQTAASMTYDGDSLQDNIPMDWSGRLLFKIDPVPTVTTKASVCITIQSDDEKLDICHGVPESRST